MSAMIESFNAPSEQESRLESSREEKKSWFAIARRSSCACPMREMRGSSAASERESFFNACECSVIPSDGSEWKGRSSAVIACKGRCCGFNGPL
jgi:hypothetical protein